MTLFSTLLGMAILAAAGVALHVVAIAGAVALIAAGALRVREVLERHQLRSQRNQADFVAAYAAALKRQQEARDACDRA